MSRKSRFGTFLIATGCLCIIAAFAFVGFNLREDGMAGDASQQALPSLRQAIEESSLKHVVAAEVIDEDDFGEGIMPTVIPDFVLNPEMSMPTMAIDGFDYCGVVTIPKLGLDLPVMDSYEYDWLRRAPCRWMGSAYTDDMIIVAHNYTSHFGTLKNLTVGDSVVFTDADGNEFHYEVCAMEELGTYDVEEAMAGDWDLTLITCTIGGATRVTVRCELIQIL